jgi:hypothetical protein
MKKQNNQIPILYPKAHNFHHTLAKKHPISLSLPVFEEQADRNEALSSMTGSSALQDPKIASLHPAGLLYALVTLCCPCNDFHNGR